MTNKLCRLALGLAVAILPAACDGDEAGSSAPDAATTASADAALDGGRASPCENVADPTCIDSAGVKLSHALYRTENMNGQLRIIISESSHLCDSSDVDPTAASIIVVVPAAPGTYQVSMVSGAWESPPAGGAAVIYSTGEAHANADDDGAYSGTVTIAAAGTLVMGSLDATGTTRGHAAGSFSATLCQDLDFR